MKSVTGLCPLQLELYLCGYVQGREMQSHFSIHFNLCLTYNIHRGWLLLSHSSFFYFQAFLDLRRHRVLLNGNK